MQNGKPRNERPHNRAYLNERRVKLRKRLTPAEARLWKMLQHSKLDGRKFRRQHSIGDYILDFYCPLEKLGIELDGQVHTGYIAEHFDDIRARFLHEVGIKVLRFENHFVFDEPEMVLNHIRSRFGWWKENDEKNQG
jgi:very-short-patch-repair endonuclease